MKANNEFFNCNYNTHGRSVKGVIVIQNRTASVHREAQTVLASSLAKLDDSSLIHSNSNRDFYYTNNNLILTINHKLKPNFTLH